MIQPFLVFNDWGLLVLRVILGLVLVAHGLPKLKGLGKTSNRMAGDEFRLSGFWALVAGLLEFVGGLLIIFGFLTQIVSFLIAVEFLVILLILQRKVGFSDKEKNLLILAIALLLVVMAGGRFAIDEYFSFILY